MDTPNGPPGGRAISPDQAHFAAVVESAAVAIVSTDPDWVVRSWSRAAETLFGYTAAEMIGRPILTLAPPDRHAETRAVVERVRDGATVPPYDAVRVRKDGSPVHVEVTPWAVRGAGGEFLGLAVAYTDRTAEGFAEEEARRLREALEQRVADLRASEERFRLMVEGVQDYAIIMIDPGGRVASWNPGAERIKGYRADEVVGRHFSLFYPAEAVARGWPQKELEEAAATGRFEDEGWRVRKDGSQFWANVVITPVRDGAGRLVGYSKVSRDLTDRKRAEDEVRRLNAELEGRVRERTADLEVANRDLAAAARRQQAIDEQFRLLVDGVKDYAIVMLDPAGRVASWNAGAERITGYAADEIMGRHLPMFHLPAGAVLGWSGDDPADARFEDEGWRVRKDGSRFWANSIMTPLRDAAGLLLGYSAVTRDLTERKRAQEELRSRAAALESANRDLAQRNAENEMFVYSVSHDLRSPLVNLQGFSRELEKACRGLTEVLADDTTPPGVRDRGQALLDGKVTKSVKFIQSAVTRLSNIIDALLRLSRAGRIEFRWEAVDVTQVATQVVQAANQTITEKGAAVTVGELPAAWGDRTAVEQVFGNLVNNALTYLDPARPGVIEVGALPAAASGTRTYFVRDNGLGIAEGHQPKIFQAFQRAHPGVGSGEGLGLAIVARVVERHGGRVWVESRPGEGSTFFVTLPAPAGGR